MIFCKYYCCFYFIILKWAVIQNKVIPTIFLFFGKLNLSITETVATSKWKMKQKKMQSILFDIILPVKDVINWFNLLILEEKQLSTIHDVECWALLSAGSQFEYY